MHELDSSTVEAVLAGRIARGLPAMLAEAYAAGYACASREPFTPSTSGMAALLELISGDHERAAHAAACAEARPAPPWLRAYAERRDIEQRLPFDDTPDRPRLIAHGIAPLPPLGCGD